MTTIETTNKNNYDEQFSKASHEFKAHWNMGREAARNSENKINHMVSISHQQYPDWSINKIAQRIYIKCQNLEGFSTRTIYNSLNEENRQLLDLSHSSHTNRKKVLEQSVATLQPNVIEESSTSTEPQITEQEADEILKDVEIEEEKPNKEFQHWRLLKAKEEEIKKQLPQKVVEYAEKYELSTNKLELLNHPKLKKYPILQEHLVYNIKDYSPQKASDKVYQTISDLDTKYLVPSETGEVFTYSGDPLKRDIISKNEAKDPHDYYMDLHTALNKLLYLLTGHKKDDREHYTKDIVNNSHNHRLDIAKSINSEFRAMYGFDEWFVKPAKMAIEDMHQILNEEMNSAEKKQEMMKE